MAEVTVVEQASGTYLVTVRDEIGSTTHTVRVPDGLPARLGCPEVPVVALVRSSFAFLLAREPAAAILPTFSLEQIGHYFPDYPESIARLTAVPENG